MFNVSMQSAMLISLVSFLIGLLGVTFMMMRFKLRYRGLSSFLIYYILKIVGVSISAFASFLPDSVREIVSNIVVYVAVLFLYAGIMRLFDQKAKRYLMALWSLVLLSVFGYFTVFSPSVQFRVITFTASIGLTFSVMLLRVLTSKLSRGFKDFIVPVSLLIIINSFIRTGRAIVSFSSTDVFLLTQDGFNVVISALLNILLLAAIYATITDRTVSMLEEANRNEKFYSSIYKTSPIPVLLGKTNGTYLHFNEAFSEKFNVDLQEAKELRLEDFCTKEDIVKIYTEIDLLEDGQKVTLYGIDIQVEDSSFTAEIIVRKSAQKEGVFEAYFIDLSGNVDFIRDLTKLNKAKEGILGAIPGFAYRCKNDDSWTMEILSDSFYSITGYHPSEVIENKTLSYNDLVLPEYRDELRADWDKAIADNEEYIGEYKIKKKDGSVIWVWERGQADPVIEGEDRTISGFISDISYRKEVEGALEYLSYHDSLTGLYNRRYMEEEMSRLDVKRNLPFTVIQLDVDGLKFANDAFGHKYGDQLISTVASILKKSLRQDEIVGRMGGDEFLILLPGVPQAKAEIVVGRVLENCKETALKTRVSVSIGTATKHSDDELLSDILSIAEERMYSNKMFKKSTMSEELVELLLEELYMKHPEELDVVNRTAKLIVQFAKHLKLPAKTVETLLRACRVHRIGLLSEAGVGHDCPYKTEETYRMIRSIPDYKEVATIIIGYCEHYDGQGHPKGYAGNEISREAQILSLCSYIALNGLDGVSLEIFKVGINQKIGSWFIPDLVNSYIEMLSK